MTCQKTQFLQCLVWGSAAQQFSQQVRDICGTMLKMRLGKSFFVLLGTASWVGFQARIFDCRAKGSELRGKWDFYISDLHIAIRTSK